MRKEKTYTLIYRLTKKKDKHNEWTNAHTHERREGTHARKNEFAKWVTNDRKNEMG